MTAALIFAVAVFLGLPLVAALAWAALGGLALAGQSLDLGLGALYSGLDQLPLTAIVGFVLAGNLMGPAGLTGELVACARRLVGRADGGLALVTILACLFFSALSGSGGATTAAVGTMMVPAMLAAGYPREYAGGMAATGGVLGILIPPSIPMIVYGAQANVPVDRLFLAGVFPGLGLAALLMLTAWLDAKRRGLAAKAAGKNPEDSTSLAKLLWRGKFAVLLPVVIMGGIWGGHFTPTEAAVAAIVWALAVGLARRRLSAGGLWKALADTSLLAGGAVILLAPATALARYLAVIGAPAAMAEFAAQNAAGPTTFLFILAGVLFFCGLFADTMSMIVIMTPIFLPAARALGVDPVVMGLIFILCSEAGFLTPPFGGNLFIAARLADVDLGRLSLAAIPYAAVIMLVAALIILMPQLVLSPLSWLSN